jgi:hypothetical protein
MLIPSQPSLCSPAVQTELHDEKHQPDVKNGRAMGMPLDEFTNLVGIFESHS